MIQESQRRTFVTVWENRKCLILFCWSFRYNGKDWLHHNTASAHTSASTLQYLGQYGVPSVSRTPSFPDQDYYLFPYEQKRLHLVHFYTSNDEDPRVLSESIFNHTWNNMSWKVKQHILGTWNNWHLTNETILGETSDKWNMGLTSETTQAEAFDNCFFQDGRLVQKTEKNTHTMKMWTNWIWSKRYSIPIAAYKKCPPLVYTTTCPRDVKKSHRQMSSDLLKVWHIYWAGHFTSVDPLAFALHHLFR